MTNETPVVLYAVEASVATLTLSRPEKRNALNEAMIEQLKSSLRKANDDSAIYAIIITGAGKDFCSGADLSALQKIADGSVDANAEDARSLLELFTLIRAVTVPVIAAVRGRALAGGCGLASACDLVLASTGARFGYPEVKIGFVPAMVTAILRRNVSEKRAFELLTRGSEIDAQTAQEFGLVNQVFAEENFDAEVRAYASRFEKLSRSAVGLTKTLLYQIDGLAFPEALAAGADTNVIARLTDDCRKGIDRFLEKKSDAP
ncbi:MAG TPA: methylglutaconyl-CoA hydratase [Blastocatellia bacterium]|nr:methylglutaconyl-CoA hydratase [Blastocatellia bacterium]